MNVLCTRSCAMRCERVACCAMKCGQVREGQKLHFCVPKFNEAFYSAVYTFCSFSHWCPTKFSVAIWLCGWTTTTPRRKRMRAMRRKMRRTMRKMGSVTTELYYCFSTCVLCVVFRRMLLHEHDRLHDSFKYSSQTITTSFLVKNMPFTQT